MFKPQNNYNLVLYKDVSTQKLYVNLIYIIKLITKIILNELPRAFWRV